MFEKFIDRILQASWERARVKNERIGETLAIARPDGPPTNRIRQFTVHEALNGHFIEYMRRKYNPSGPDDYVREIYIVQPDESLVDAISTVLVLLDK